MNKQDNMKCQFCGKPIIDNKACGCHLESPEKLKVRGKPHFEDGAANVSGWSDEIVKEALECITRICIGSVDNPSYEKADFIWSLNSIKSYAVLAYQSLALYKPSPSTPQQDIPVSEFNKNYIDPLCQKPQQEGEVKTVSFANLIKDEKGNLVPAPWMGAAIQNTNTILTVSQSPSHIKGEEEKYPGYESDFQI